MAHYALLNENNVVTQVITGKDEGEQRDGVDVDWEEWYKDFHGAADCKRTSYNTVANRHREGGTPFRGNFAGVGSTYDAVLDIFIPPKPSDDMVWDSTNLEWVDVE